jgi:hypothetical protein
VQNSGFLDANDNVTYSYHCALNSRAEKKDNTSTESSLLQRLLLSVHAILLSRTVLLDSRTALSVERLSYRLGDVRIGVGFPEAAANLLSFKIPKEIATQRSGYRTHQSDSNCAIAKRKSEVLRKHQPTQTPFPESLKFNFLCLLGFMNRKRIRVHSFLFYDSVWIRLLFSEATAVWKHRDSCRQVKHEMPRGTAVTKVSGQGAMTLRD